MRGRGGRLGGEGLVAVFQSRAALRSSLHVGLYSYCTVITAPTSTVGAVLEKDKIDGPVTVRQHCQQWIFYFLFAVY